MLAQPPHLASPMILHTVHASVPDESRIWGVCCSTLITLFSNQTQLQLSPACWECSAGCRKVITPAFAHSQAFGECETPPATISVLVASESDLMTPLKNWLQLNPPRTSRVWHTARSGSARASRIYRCQRQDALTHGPHPSHVDCIMHSRLEENVHHGAQAGIQVWQSNRPLQHRGM